MGGWDGMGWDEGAYCSYRLAVPDIIRAVISGCRGLSQKQCKISIVTSTHG